MLGRSPEEVAKFLAKSQGLNKTMIGEYLGEREDTCIRVMHAFIDGLDFSGLEFDTSIRSDCAVFCKWLLAEICVRSNSLYFTVRLSNKACSSC